jgi:hypothetical protein
MGEYSHQSCRNRAASASVPADVWWHPVGVRGNLWFLCIAFEKHLAGLPETWCEIMKLENVSSKTRGGRENETSAFLSIPECYEFESASGHLSRHSRL